MAVKPKTRSATHQLPALSMRAAVSPESLDAEKRTVEVVWTTGERVMRGFWERYYEELSLKPAHVRMGRLNGGAPLLDAHNGFELRGVVGVVEKARIEKGQGTATVRFARAEDDPNADAIFRKVQDGIIRNVSVGYRIHRLEKIEEDDDKIPVYRATDWEPYEISMVPMGADAGAGVRAQSADTNPCEVVAEERAMKTKKKGDPQSGTPAQAIATDEVEGEERAADEDETEDEQPAEARTETAPAGREQGARRERDRIVGIYRLARSMKIAEATVNKAIKDGTSLDRFRATAQDEFEAADPITVQPGGARVEAGADARDKWLRGAGDWLVIRATLDGTVAEAAKKLGPDAARRLGHAGPLDPGEFRGLSLVELARMSLERGGVRTAGMDKLKLVGEALTQRGGGYHAIGDFSTLLENVMHKVLLAQYAITPDTWSRFCATGSVSDFRAHPRYRLGTFGSLPLKVEGAEYANLSLADAKKESLTAATKGAMVGITREAIINDDMGAFNRIGAMVGRSAKLTVEKDVYALLAQNAGLGPTMDDGIVLFNAAHANIGTGSALTVAGLDADRVVMGSQMDPSSNEFLDLRPAILLVPLGLGGEARVINEAVYDTDAVANKPHQKPNKSRGLVRDIVDTARISGTRRYLFADPSVAPVIEVAFLDGQTMPFMEVRDSWTTDGVQWKVRLDYGVDAIDFRGAVTNAGA